MNKILKTSKTGRVVQILALTFTISLWICQGYLASSKLFLDLWHRDIFAGGLNELPWSKFDEVSLLPTLLALCLTAGANLGCTTLRFPDHFTRRKVAKSYQEFKLLIYLPLAQSYLSQCCDNSRNLFGTRNVLLWDEEITIYALKTPIR